MSKSVFLTDVIDVNQFLLIEDSLHAADTPYELTHCEAVEAALRKVSGYATGNSNRPDLLLLDYNLPGGDAREVI
jgi:CheY-like chemotaxis protein